MARAFRVPVPVSYTAAWLAMLAGVNLPAAAVAQAPCSGIHVTILNIRNSIGTVACALFDSPEGFPNEFLLSATNVMVIKIRESQARCDFEDIPPAGMRWQSFMTRI